MLDGSLAYDSRHATKQGHVRQNPSHNRRVMI